MKPTDVVYLVGNADNRLVKIGTTSKHSLERLSGIQTMSPSILTVLWTTPGDKALEHKLHYRFRAERRHGEWFDFGERDPIAEVSAAAAEMVLAIPIEARGVSDGYESAVALVETLETTANHLSGALADDVVTVGEVVQCLSGLARSMFSIQFAAGMATANATAWDTDPVTVEEVYNELKNVRDTLATAKIGFESALMLLDTLVDRS